MGTGATALSRGLKELLEKELIYQLKNNHGEIQYDCYLINPKHVGRTDWRNLEFLQRIRVEITYEKSLKTLVTIFEEYPKEKQESLKEGENPTLYENWKNENTTSTSETDLVMTEDYEFL